jgi:hypothetical protein
MNEDQLRRILDAQAQRVEVQPDALAEIRRRIAARRVRWLPRGGAMFAISASTATAVAATVLAVFVGLDGCVPRGEPTPGASGPSSSPTTSPTTSPPAVTPTPSAGTGTPPRAGTASLGIYFIGIDRYTREDGQVVNQSRLYREFHQLQVGDGSAVAKTRAALTEMLDGRNAYDPNYISTWPAGTKVRDIAISGGVVTVDLAGVHNTSDPGQRDPTDIRMAVEQLIWTASAASGTSGGVKLLLDGKAISSLWGVVNTTGVLRKAAVDSVLAPVWLISPQQGATVGRTFQVHISANAFESTVHVRVRKGSTVVKDMYLTLGPGSLHSGEGKMSLTLAPGTYTVDVYVISAADGTSIQHLDGHVITVK